ncbi:hypothetical protein [Actinomycetospora cinnamomea]|uniref:Uncharacterized protein n=1 Tax=Actinomycetospora cinnamomea TaxID=663609 RepID=A0A2U1FPU3_9PSEU|nr:hypothetical protein [Actinomycetospora cinnamomea]PVZ14213.1 hypothetical protein C8D89_10177 [Actinomycetospora cinnamomea]
MRPAPHPAADLHRVRWTAPVPWQPPAGLVDLAELEPTWAHAAHHAAVAVTAGHVGDAHTWTPWGYPPPAAYRGLVPHRPVPAVPAPVVPAPRPRATTPAALAAMAAAAIPTARV